MKNLHTQSTEENYVKKKPIKCKHKKKNMRKIRDVIKKKQKNPKNSEIFGSRFNGMKRNIKNTQFVIKSVKRSVGQFMNGNFSDFSNWIPVDIIKLM